MNPFDLNPTSIEKTFESFCSLYPKPYHPLEVDPYTKCRIILMNGTEFEAVKFTHQMARHVQDQSLRRELAMLRRTEQQQQKKLANLKPIHETVLEHTISYEQLAVDLTAMLAKRVKTAHAKAALDLALLEDFDHLYRYADLMEMDTGEHAERLVGRYTEIMPGRPTISEHRMPLDGIPTPIGRNAPLFDKLAAHIITAAEQQTMNYYMNITGFYKNDLGRKLYQEIGMIEEQHVTQYEALQDPTLTWLEGLLLHEYTECYLYWSCAQTETDERIRSIWSRHFEQEVAHLHKAAQLLEQVEGKHWQQLLPDAAFPEPLRLESNIDYVRTALLSAQLTYKNTDPVPVQSLQAGDPFFVYQDTVHARLDHVASHAVIEETINRLGQDYRFETAPHPVKELMSRGMDNTQIGRDPHIPGYTGVMPS
ncbi:MAG TPA: hypothetical protein IAC49_08215 [Candidatus Ventricola intestinavium]|nr:hypothetical protein [Candidatus Ventricola intestinavium]